MRLSSCPLSALLPGECARAVSLFPFVMLQLLTSRGLRWCAFLENLTEEMQEAGQVRMNCAASQRVLQLTATARPHSLRFTTIIAS